jgi:hypothetical protein
LQRRRDSNPRTALTVSGFQDRCNKPLYHSSVCDLAFLRTAKVNGNSNLAKTAFEFVLLIAEIRKSLLQILVVIILISRFAGIQF